MFSSTNFSSQRALAIETSGRNGSVALLAGRAVVGEAVFSHGLKHAAGLLPMIDGLMRQQNWGPSSLAQIYVSQGPGSFTGLRIGITLAKALAFATGAQIVAVPTTRVLAANAPAEAKHLVIVLDAKRDQIFTARFEREMDGWSRREPDQLDSLAHILPRSPRPLHLLGEGLPFHLQFLPRQHEDIFITGESTWTARAQIVAEIGIKMAEQGLFTSADELKPLYIRKPEAEEKYDLQHQPNM